MVRLVEVRLVCDHCREQDPDSMSEATETVQAAIGSPTVYELDVCADHYKQLSELGAFLAEHGRPLRTGKPGRPPKDGPPPVGKWLQSENRDTDGRYVCPDCDFITNSGTGLAAHRRGKHLDTDTVTCPECGKACNGRQGLTMHKTSAHSKTIFCPECHEKFTSRSGLGSHLRAKHPQVDRVLPGIN